MMKPLLYLASLGFVALAPLHDGMAPADGPSTPTPQVTPDQGEVAPDHEGGVSDASLRLRKLHLVRPDLIPYPLAVETYC